MKFAFFQKLLTVQQNEALKKAYTLCENSLQPILIIDGCPGSGKTTILLELVYKLAVVLQKRVLVCSGNSTTTDTHASSLDRMSNACKYADFLSDLYSSI